MTSQAMSVLQDSARYRGLLPRDDNVSAYYKIERLSALYTNKIRAHSITF